MVSTSRSRRGRSRSGSSDRASDLQPAEVFLWDIGGLGGSARAPGDRVPARTAPCARPHPREPRVRRPASEARESLCRSCSGGQNRRLPRASSGDADQVRSRDRPREYRQRRQLEIEPRTPRSERATARRSAAGSGRRCSTAMIRKAIATSVCNGDRRASDGLKARSKWTGGLRVCGG